MSLPLPRPLHHARPPAGPQVNTTYTLTFKGESRLRVLNSTTQSITLRPCRVNEALAATCACAWAGACVCACVHAHTRMVFACVRVQLWGWGRWLEGGPSGQVHPFDDAASDAWPAWFMPRPRPHGCAGYTAGACSDGAKDAGRPSAHRPPACTPHAHHALPCAAAPRPSPPLPPCTADACVACGAGFYSLNGSSTTCLDCPVGATCNSDLLSGAMLVARDGYWHSGPLSSNVLACPRARACRYRGRLGGLARLQAELLANGSANASAAAAAYRQEQCAEVRLATRRGACTAYALFVWPCCSVLRYCTTRGTTPRHMCSWALLPFRSRLPKTSLPFGPAACGYAPRVAGPSSVPTPPSGATRATCLRIITCALMQMHWPLPTNWL